MLAGVSGWDSGWYFGRTYSTAECFSCSTFDVRPHALRICLGRSNYSSSQLRPSDLCGNFPLVKVSLINERPASHSIRARGWLVENQYSNAREPLSTRSRGSNPSWRRHQLEHIILDAFPGPTSNNEGTVHTPARQRAGGGVAWTRTGFSVCENSPRICGRCCRAEVLRPWPILIRKRRHFEFGNNPGTVGGECS